jgi:hypothetical protein
MKKIINAKTLNEKLKNNWTVAEFAQYYEMSEEEFLSTLETTFSPKAYKGMKKRLDQIQKRFERLNKNAILETLENTTEILENDSFAPFALLTIAVYVLFFEL